MSRSYDKYRTSLNRVKRERQELITILESDTGLLLWSSRVPALVMSLSEPIGSPVDQNIHRQHQNISVIILKISDTGTARSRRKQLSNYILELLLWAKRDYT